MTRVMWAVRWVEDRAWFGAGGTDGNGGLRNWTMNKKKRRLFGSRSGAYSMAGVCDGSRVVKVTFRRKPKKSLGQFAVEAILALHEREGTSGDQDCYDLGPIVDAEVLRRAAVKP